MESNEHHELPPKSKALQESIEVQGIKEGDQITIHTEPLGDDAEGGGREKMIFSGIGLADDATTLASEGSVILYAKNPPDTLYAGEGRGYIVEDFDELRVTAGWDKE